MKNYILDSNGWVELKGKYTVPSLKLNWCINLYDDNLKHIGHGYYCKSTIN